MLLTLMTKIKDNKQIYDFNTYLYYLLVIKISTTKLLFLKHTPKSWNPNVKTQYLYYKQVVNF